MNNRLAKRVLLIGWDAADWRVMNPLLDAGLMPTLEGVISDGVMGNISTLQPIISPMLWTSIATGMRPHKHGIHGFIELIPGGRGLQLVSSASRRTKAIWNILNQSGLKSHVLSWYASHPAEEIDGLCVTNVFSRAVGDLGAPWPLLPRTIHPAKYEAVLGELRVHPGEIEGVHLQPFMPRAAEIDQESPIGQKALGVAARLLAECASVHAAATWAMEHEPWDFCAVYYDGIDHFCHAFMPFHQWQVDEVAPAAEPPPFDPAIFADVVRGIYRFHDMMLERLLQLAGEDTTVIIVSDHGFHSGEFQPANAKNPVNWHRQHGMIAMRGPGIRKDERIYGASILDIAPTILTLFGLPVGSDMDGKPLVQAFVETPAVERVDSWESIPGRDGCGEAPPPVIDSEATRQSLKQLVELGYIDPLSEDEDKNARMVSVELRYNLAVALEDAGKFDEAIPLLEALLLEADEDRFRIALAQSYYSCRRLREMREVLSKIFASESSSPTEKDSSDARSRPRVDMLLGLLAFAEGQLDVAMKHLCSAQAAGLKSPQLYNQIGRIFLQTRHWNEAHTAFQSALELDADNAQAAHGLSVVVLRQGRAREAAELALRAVGLQHHFPAAHFQLGAALARMQMTERAIQAFETGLTMRPNAVAAHRYLSTLYLRVGDAARAHKHLQRARDLKLSTTRDSGHLDSSKTAQ